MIITSVDWIPPHGWNGPDSVLYKSLDTVEDFTLVEGNEMSSFDSLVCGKGKNVIEIFEFSINVFIEFTKFSEKVFFITVKGLEPTISCVRDHDTTTVPERHM